MMGTYHFGTHNGFLTAAADKIAKRHGASHTNYLDPAGKQRRGWFSCPNRGSPFDEGVARAVMADIDKRGGLTAFLHKQDCTDEP